MKGKAHKRKPSFQIKNISYLQNLMKQKSPASFQQLDMLTF